MNLKIYLLMIFGFILFQSVYAEEYEYFIITNTNTEIHWKPSIHSGVVKLTYRMDYEEHTGFFPNQLLRTYTITNISGDKWALIYEDYPEWKGWIQMSHCYRFSENGNDGKLFYEIVRKELLEYREYDRAAYSVSELNLTNFNNGYVMIHFELPGDESVISETYYKFENDTWKRVLEKGDKYKEYIFYKHFIILLDNIYRNTDVYDTKQLEPLPYRHTEEYYKHIIISFDPYYEFTKDKIRDSFESFDTNTGILTAHVRVSTLLPYLSMNYQFNETTADFDPLYETGNYYILTGDNVNIRSVPSMNSSVLYMLKINSKVKLIYRSDIELSAGDKKGYWAYVDTEIKDEKERETIKGWVFDYYLKEEGK